ncbi:MAG: hypothetical protein K0R28_5255 [Paenibacillus sp.]|jgi:uncharacterized membrane protein|nr:hypothetical protein [Paenibacillus sp.]
MYNILLFIHIVAAVMGLGAAFGFPIVAKTAKTASQAKHTLELLKRLEILPKVGSIALLITGLILGIITPSLFTSGWYIASIVLYLAAQVIVIGMLPKQMKAQADILEQHSGEDLPQTYIEVGKKSAKLEGITHVLAFLLIALMYFKPF